TRTSASSGKWPRCARRRFWRSSLNAAAAPLIIRARCSLDRSAGGVTQAHRIVTRAARSRRGGWAVQILGRGVPFAAVLYAEIAQVDVAGVDLLHRLLSHVVDEFPRVRRRGWGARGWRNLQALCTSLFRIRFGYAIHSVVRAGGRS